ncbi:Glycoside hydrolase family 9 [Dillenia turbinata]|uniref:Endoglucanase n=1 Tax=Dillenia turbinata TaxID=194707 RepID=A0AAN8Z4R6_9MAGN
MLDSEKSELVKALVNWVWSASSSSYCHNPMSFKTKLCLMLLCNTLLFHGVVSINYREALHKSLLFFEAQRSGKLPTNQRVQWRGDSALNDGKDVNVNLVGGYYDAGDNVKFGFPMAYTITMLSWAAVEFGDSLKAKNELSNTLAAVKWGTDFFIKAHTEPDVLYGQVGEGRADHECWQRPEDMTTPQTAFKIDKDHPGSDLAGETAAALAAAAIAFKASNPAYSQNLLNHAKQLFDFASKYLGQYQNSIPGVGEFYGSSGFELLWAAAWLHRATGDSQYADFLSKAGSGGTRNIFSWDNKYIGAQVLVAKLVLEDKVSGQPWENFKNDAEQFVCNLLQKGNNNIKKTPGGLLWFLPWANLQYTISSTFILAAYSKYINHASLQCVGGAVQASELLEAAKSQVDYVLGSNPNKISYMIGFGSSYPTQVHHRGASIVSIKKDPTPVGCKEGFDKWFHRQAPNPNVLEGGIVGGPDENDGYIDSRGDSTHAEPATATNAPLVGVLAQLA